MARSRTDDEAAIPSDSPIADAQRECAAETVQPWEQIETGRYMPRRIRGSLRGRELG